MYERQSTQLSFSLGNNLQQDTPSSYENDEKGNHHLVYTYFVPITSMINIRQRIKYSFWCLRHYQIHGASVVYF